MKKIELKLPFRTTEFLLYLSECLSTDPNVLLLVVSESKKGKPKVVSIYLKEDINIEEAVMIGTELADISISHYDFLEKIAEEEAALKAYMGDLPGNISAAAFKRPQEDAAEVKEEACTVDEDNPQTCVEVAKKEIKTAIKYNKSKIMELSKEQLELKKKILERFQN